MKELEEARDSPTEPEEEREEHEEHYEGPWWRFPPMRNALAGGLLLAIGFALSFVPGVGKS